jgi:hypothetical protein
MIPRIRCVYTGLNQALRNGGGISRLGRKCRRTQSVNGCEKPDGSAAIGVRSDRLIERVTGLACIW